MFYLPSGHLQVKSSVIWVVPHFTFRSVGAVAVNANCAFPSNGVVIVVFLKDLSLAATAGYACLICPVWWIA